MLPDTLDVILSHEHTDFDALASLFAASLVFREAMPVLPRQLNHNVRDFLALYRDHFPFVRPDDLPRLPVRRAILVDTNSFNAVKGMGKETEYLVIDHHSEGAQADSEEPAHFGEPLPPQWQIWQEALGPHAVGANTTLLVEKLMVQDRHLSPVQATLLALGIYEDTGCLVYKSTTARDARSVTWLLEQGANLEVIGRFIRYALSDEQRRLYQVLMENSQHLTIVGHTVVIAQARATGFQEELSSLAHKLRNLYKPDVLYLIIDLGDRIQVVARSTTDNVDVGAVATALGGGGHTRAAAALIRGQKSAAVHSRIVELTHQHSRPPVTVRRIMSLGRPQILAPDTPVQRALELMRRYGHEGFPVVEATGPASGPEPAAEPAFDTAEQGGSGEKLLGMLTRREADRAVSHGLGKEPVRRFMRAGSVTVTPDDPIHILQKRMIDSSWGQIPVVNQEGTIIGIVTRTDLIKLWGETEPQGEMAAAASKAEIARRLAQTLSPLQHRLLRLAGETAAQANQAVYVVGGFARDLLLDVAAAQVKPLDMDIVVEGDAIALAERLQARCGGRVVTHRRFGTAKWLLDDLHNPLHCAELDQGPTTENRRSSHPSPLRPRQTGELPNLDFVTARTEFYTEPTALPTVERSSIKLDLHRRDFTINTLAISLNPDRWGELIDSYGGLNDLRQGVVRVLHSLSFVDDPTRILRAVRYEQRFDFQIEPRTLELLQDAVELLDKVTAARIRHELERILQEPIPERPLNRLDELGVLRCIHPQLQAGDWLRHHFAVLRADWEQPTSLLSRRLHGDLHDPLESLYWGLLVYRMPPHTDEEMVERLRLRKETQRLVRSLHRLQAHLPELRDPALRPSQAVEILDEAPPAAMYLVALVEPDRQLRRTLYRYLVEWQHIQAGISGQHLRALGLKPSPLFGRILRRVRAARLEGAIHSDPQALALAARLARPGAEEGTDGTQ